MQKFEEGRKQELTFADACRFWGITENMHGDALDARLDQFAGELTGPGPPDRHRQHAELSNGRDHRPTDDRRMLADLHRYLEERFGRHLNLLRSRVERIGRRRASGEAQPRARRRSRR